MESVMQALRPLRRAASFLLQPLVRRCAARYIAGPELPDALRVVERLRRASVPTTIGYWDGPGDEPRGVQQHYLAAIETIWRDALDSYPSIKLPALRDQLRLIEPVIDLAIERGVRLHFDSLGPESANQTLATASRAATRGTMTSCTIPGRWQRSPEDAERAMAAGVVVRVVKGQWADPHYPAIDPRSGFMAVVERVARKATHVAIATHDVALGEQAIERLQATGTSCEWELLYGLPARAALTSAASLQVPVRFYIPYGQAYLPYALSAAARNPRLLCQVLRDAGRGWFGSKSLDEELQGIADWPALRSGASEGSASARK